MKGSTLHSRGEVEVGLNWVEPIQETLGFGCNLAQMIAYWCGILNYVDFQIRQS